MKHWLVHTAIFLVAQVVFLTLGYSWPWEVLSGRVPITAILASVDGQQWFANTSRIWSIIWLADGIYSFISSSLAKDKRAGAAGNGST